MHTHILQIRDSRFRRFFQIAFLFSSLVLGSVLLVGCDSNGSDGDNPPDLLSADVFSVQTDLFQSGTPKNGGTKLNFTAAALRVWPVSLVLTAHSIIPVAVTAAAVNDTPEFNDGAWEWSTSVAVQTSTISFTLYGEPSGSTINWTMEISGSDPANGVDYTSFDLYTATTTVGEQSGSWHLFYDIEGVRTNVLDATFDVTSDDEKSITFSVPRDLPDIGGDSVEYATNGDARSFLWQQLNLSQSHAVEWNAVTKVGSIESSNYNNGEKACWDENLDDISCTP